MAFFIYLTNNVSDLIIVTAKIFSSLYSANGSSVRFFLLMLIDILSVLLVFAIDIKTEFLALLALNIAITLHLPLLFIISR